MGTLAAGIKEIFATAKTTGSNVMLCGNDGTPDGHMTIANLASVLGASGSDGRHLQADANTIIEGRYFARSLDIDSYHIPADYGYLFARSVTQIAYTIIYQSFVDLNRVHYERYGNGPEGGPYTWSGWNRADNFQCVTLSDLANALGALDVEFIKQTCTEAEWGKEKEYTFENIPSTTFIFWMNTIITNGCGLLLKDGTTVTDVSKIGNVFNFRGGSTASQLIVQSTTSASGNVKIFCLRIY